jgi:hypothetical protein
MTRAARTGFATAIALAIVAALLPATPLAAQDLPEGMWTGSITTPDGAFDVQYEVVGSGDELSVTMVAPTGDQMPFDDVRLADGILHLAFSLPSLTVECELAGAEDGSYEGECAGSDGNGGVLKMIPPSDG